MDDGFREMGAYHVGKQVDERLRENVRLRCVEESSIDGQYYVAKADGGDSFHQQLFLTRHVHGELDTWGFRRHNWENIDGPETLSQLKLIRVTKRAKTDVDNVEVLSDLSLVMFHQTREGTRQASLCI